MDLTNAAPLGLALLGLGLGIRHATDADHVIAVTTIVSRERRIGAASRIGLVWGIGHTITVMIVGVAIIGFKIAIPARLGLTMEFAVAIVLILLGLSAMRAGFARHRGSGVRFGSLLVHSHSHAHDGATHAHPHVHEYQPSADDTHHNHLLTPEVAASLPPPRSLLRAFGVGLVHGLAGSAAIALLVLSAIPQPAWAILYLAVFGAGTLIGMVLITTAIGMPVVLAAGSAGRFHNAIGLASGLMSLVFGLIVAYQITFVDGLFGAFPSWTPR